MWSMLLGQALAGRISFPNPGRTGGWCDDTGSVAGRPAVCSPATRIGGSVSGRQQIPLELMLSALNTPEPLQHIRENRGPAGQAWTTPSGRMSNGSLKSSHIIGI